MPRSGLNQPLPDLIRARRIGTPTVTIQCDVVKPLRMGETLRFELQVTKVGNASVQLSYVGRYDAAEHLRIRQTIASMALDAGVATPIPEDLRPRIEAYLAQ